jgi:hypothetical protein
MLRRLAVSIALLAGLSVMSASSIGVTISGNFGPSSAGSSVLDNRSYFINFTIPDPHSPTMIVDAPGAQVSATYHVSASLDIPGLGVAVTKALDVSYVKQAPLGIWMNIFTFTGLPVGDFMVLTPLQTISGIPLWNGLAGSLGQPEISLLNGEPASARFFVEQNTPNMGPIPIAIYDHGTATITSLSAGSVPESSTLTIMPFVVLGLACWRRAKTRHR